MTSAMFCPWGLTCLLCRTDVVHGILNTENHTQFAFSKPPALKTCCHIGRCHYPAAHGGCGIHKQKIMHLKSRIPARYLHKSVLSAQFFVLFFFFLVIVDKNPMQPANFFFSFSTVTNTLLLNTESFCVFNYIHEQIWERLIFGMKWGEARRDFPRGGAPDVRKGVGGGVGGGVTGWVAGVCAEQGATLAELGSTQQLPIAFLAVARMKEGRVTEEGWKWGMEGSERKVKSTVSPGRLGAE